VRAALDNGSLPSDLGEWIIAELLARAAAPDRIALRNELLVTAAKLMDGSMWQKANRIHSELCKLARRHGATSPITKLLVDAELAYPCPRSPRQIYRVLVLDIGTGGDVSDFRETLAP
jgi:hypothetical protein